MKSKVLMILSACAAVHNAHTSSLTSTTQFNFSMHDTAHAVSRSVSEAFKNHPYLFGGVAVLGTAAIMCKVLQSKKEGVGERRSVSPDESNLFCSEFSRSPESRRPSSDSDSAYSSPNGLELMGRTEKGFLTVGECCSGWVEEEEEKNREHADKAKRIEKIRIVQLVLKREDDFVKGRYRASLARHKATGNKSVFLKGADGRGYCYLFLLSSDNEGTSFCQTLNEYLDPSTKAVAEKKLRELIGLRDEQLWDEGILKSLLHEIRSSIPLLEEDELFRRTA
jgi:hypothetical protein